MFRNGSANAIAEYQISGLPWVTQSNASTSPTRLDFPNVTKDLTIQNNGSANIFVGFTQNGVMGSNRFTIKPSGSLHIEFRLKTLYLLAEASNPQFEVIAGLTSVPSAGFPTLTGSAVYNSGSAANEWGYGFPGIGQGTGLG